ncbi:hypothetical protein [Herbiconiux liukaitaii]|uniref:hypothetical protein n=1 Tax=Herbiconiux liukaitaii TaxID=3342799 RepID=UPI0035BAF9C4
MMIVFGENPSPEQLGRLEAFLTHLDEPQSTVARGMVHAGAEIVIFWGPEQMDVWRLELAHGPVIVRFGIERGFSYGIEMDHPGLRDRLPSNGLTPFIVVWMVWASRTGTLARQFDPAAPGIEADFDAWPLVVEWLRNVARGPDFTAIDDLRDLMNDLRGGGYRMSHPIPEAQRTAAVVKILKKGRGGALG